MQRALRAPAPAPAAGWFSSLGMFSSTPSTPPQASKTPPLEESLGPPRPATGPSKRPSRPRALTYYLKEKGEDWKKQNGKLKMSTAKGVLREKKKEWSKYWDQHMHDGLRQPYTRPITSWAKLGPPSAAGLTTG